MDPIELLMNEHRTIEQVLDALVTFADEARRKETTEKDELARFVSFLSGFADACHHGKEEGILFAAMVDHGFPKDGGPIAVMLAEHDRGRGLIGMLRAHADQEGAWSVADRQNVADVARGYAELLREHIHKEDAILYPMAEQHLPPEAMERMGELFERFEVEETGAGEHEKLHALAEELISRHGGAVHPGSDAPPHAHAHPRSGCCG